MHSARLQIEVPADSDAALLRLSGELDAESAGSLVAEAGQLVREGQRHVVLDCAGVTFCDSFGLRAMTQLWLQVQPDGSLTIARPSDFLLRILEITGLADRFLIADGRADPPTDSEDRVGR